MSDGADPQQKPGQDEAPPSQAAESPQGWQPADPERPRSSELFIAAVMVSLLAGLVLWGSSSVEQEPAPLLGEIEPAQALDPRAVPSGAFVSVSGKPDASRLAPVYPMGPAREQSVLLALREEPRLVLHCRQGHPLLDVLRRHRTPPGQPPAALPGELEEVWTFSGRIFDADKYSDPQLSSSGMSVQQFVGEKLGASDGAAVRVLAVGVTPADLRRSAQTALFFGVAMTLVAIVLWTLAFHSVAQDRRKRREAHAAP